MKPKYQFVRFQKSTLSLSASIMVCLSSGAMAQTQNLWTGAVSSAWNTDGNWSAGVIPTKTPGNYHAVINTNTGNVATISVGIIPPVDILIGSGAGANGRLDHTAGDASTGSGNWMNVGEAGGTGIYNLANTGASGGTFTGYATGSGSMNTNGGRFYVGGNSSSGGTGTANINTTGSLTVGSECNISASGGTGTLNLDNGTIITNDWTRIGGGTGSTGTLNMSGGTITKQGNNNFVIGGTGSTGTANVSGGTINVNNEFWVANSAGSKGTLNLSGGLITNNSWASIGRSGATLGKVVMTGGAWNKTGGGNFLVGDGSPGQLDLSGGSITANGEVWVGQGGGANGTFNLSNSGSIANNSWVAVGRSGGTGTVNMTGGTWTKTGNGTSFIVASSGPGTFNQSGGLVDVQQGDTWMGEGGSGSYSLSGSGEFRASYFQVARNSGSTITVNLDGGTLQATQIAGGGGSSTVNFNGTQIIAKASSSFIAGLTTANVKSGGLKIDSAGFNLTVPQLLAAGSPSGGLNKTGFGTLDLSAANTYTGPTSINGGKLALTTASLANGAITLADYTALGVTQTTANQAYSSSSVTFGVSDTTTLDLDLGAFAGNTSSAPLNVTGSGALTLNGVVTVNVTDNLPVVGTIPLVSYTGGKSGAGSFALGTLPDGVVATLSDNGTDLVSLNVTRVNDAYWTGAVDSNWDTSTANWKDDYAETASTYADGDPVMFDDRVVAAGPAISVSLNGAVSPGGSGVTFANVTKNYTLTGAGKISGTTGLLKQGAGTVTLDTTNDYTGVTKVNGGTLKVATVTNGGVPSPIGAADASSENLVLSGGTLYYTGASTSTDRGFTTTGAGSITTDNELTISGAASSTSTGNFSKSGAGNLKFTIDGLNIFGGTGAAGLTVLNGPLTFDGTGTSQINSVVNDIWVGTTATAGGSLVLNNTTVATSGAGYLAIARGSGTTGLTSTCTLTNSTLSTGNLSLGYANAVAGYLATSVLTLNDSTYTLTGINRLSESAGSTGTIFLNGASIMTVGDSNIAQDNGSNGTLDVKGTSLYTSNGRLQVGVNSGATGNVIIENTGSVVVNSYVSIGYNGVGSMTVRDSGTFSNNDDFSINESGSAPASVTLQDNGSITVGKVVFVGRNSGRVGTLTQTGGTFTSTGNEFQIGKFGTGSWIQSGGVTNAGGWVSIARETGGTGVLTVSGTGSFTQTGTDRGLIVGEFGNGTLNIQGNATVTSLGSSGVFVSNGGTGTGVVNLDGGTLQALRIADGGGTGTLNLNGGTVVAKRVTEGTAGTSTVNFNGGLLKAATGAATTFVSGIDSAVIQSGGAKIDTNGQNLTVPQLLSGTGGLTKSGSGTLTLSGANTYSGPTSVNGGTLSVSSAFFANTSAISISGGAVLNLAHSVTDQVGTLSINGVSMPPGIYDSTTSPGSITGTGKLSVTGTASPYDTWISGYPSIPVADRDPGDDPDHDGFTNAMEFALGGVPNNGGSGPRVYQIVADSSADGDSTSELLLTIAVRAGTPAFTGSPSPGAVLDGYTYRVEGSTTLSGFSTGVVPVNPVTAGLPAAPSGYEYRSFSLSGSNGMPGKGFLRAVVVSP